jgi:Cu+-exporting ATPase
MQAVAKEPKVACYHCGEDAMRGDISIGEKSFCCTGCRMVYQLLNQNGLCNYYSLNHNPGTNQRLTVRKDKFDFLGDREIQQKLISFADDKQTFVTFYLPQIHCSSCLFLLENLHRLHNGVVSCRVNFARKEAEIVFHQNSITLRAIAELLTAIGYEPYISFGNAKNHQPRTGRRMIYQLGVAGFCFGNIMMLSFPEYLGLQEAEKGLQGFFRLLALTLSLPAAFYSAQPFYTSGWKSLKHGFLNIDAPIALAVIVTFGRSIYEVMTGTGSGYFDSMSGIVFFMLVGRVLQDKTYRQLSFERDFTSYFPIAATVLRDSKEIPVALKDIKAGDTLLIHHEELIPADGILTRGKALIDYSFVTGESVPAGKDMGEIVYAGGKQTGGAIEILVIKEVMQSYLTNLWERDELKNAPEEKSRSFVHLVSRWFTYIVFLIALVAGLYWAFTDSSKIWNVATAVLIIACPCALLLSNTFTNGNILRILSRNKLYLRGAQTIEDISNINHIVFDKTGTLTTAEKDIVYNGYYLDTEKLQAIKALATQSNHPLSRVLAGYYQGSDVLPTPDCYSEVPGLGLKGFVNGLRVAIGSRQFITGEKDTEQAGSTVHVSVEGIYHGYFSFRNHYRDFVPALIKQLPGHYGISVVSGDNDSEKPVLKQLFGRKTTIQFRQSPNDKLDYITSLQQCGHRVMMIGDGLNDAGALRQSSVGIAVTEDCNNFTPASDAIMQANQLSKLHSFIRLCKANRYIVTASFVLSVMYNVMGLWFAVHGSLSPLIAAILMPCSSLSILLITYGSSNLVAKWLKL